MPRAKMFFKLFACCIPVKGAAASLICDLQRGTYCDIPNSLFTILTEYAEKDFEELVEIFGDKETLNEYFDFLIHNEFGFYTSTPDRFPPLQEKWEHPSAITNAIIDFDDNSAHELRAVFRQLETLGCVDLQLRFFNKVLHRDTPENALKLLRNSRVAKIELILPFQPFLTESYIVQLCKQHPRIHQITVYGHQEQLKLNVYAGNPKELIAYVSYTDQVIRSETHCGIIDPQYFVISTDTYMESKLFNSCLNRKISVSKEGFIKNCPSMTEHFGHISSTSIIEVVADQKFRKLWGVNKDQIAVCRDCEYRYICTDCRAYVADDDLFGKPRGCSYDPYTRTWQSETPETEGVIPFEKLG